MARAAVGIDELHLERPIACARMSRDFLAREGVEVGGLDGEGAWRDNVFVARLRKSVKYEEVRRKAYGAVAETRGALGRYLDFYNRHRPHSSLDRRNPDEAYFEPSPMAAAA